MKVEISRVLLEQIMSEAAADANEVCGLLMGDASRIAAIRPAANVAPDRARHFELDPVVLVAAHRAARAGGERIVGHYHSHPSGMALPSATDAASAAADGSFWLIVGSGVARLWIATAGEGGKVRFEEALLDIM